MEMGTLKIYQTRSGAPRIGKVNVGENSRRAAQAFNALSASDRQVWEDKAAERNQEENEADEREIATVGEVEFIRRR